MVINAMEKNPAGTGSCNFKQRGQNDLSGKVIFKLKNLISNCISHSACNSLSPISRAIQTLHSLQNPVPSVVMFILTLRKVYFD